MGTPIQCNTTIVGVERRVARNVGSVAHNRNAHAAAVRYYLSMSSLKSRETRIPGNRLIARVCGNNGGSRAHNNHKRRRCRRRRNTSSRRRRESFERPLSLCRTAANRRCFVPAQYARGYPPTHPPPRNGGQRRVCIRKKRYGYSIPGGIGERTVLKNKT